MKFPSLATAFVALALLAWTLTIVDSIEAREAPALPSDSGASKGPLIQDRPVFMPAALELSLGFPTGLLVPLSTPTRAAVEPAPRALPVPMAHAFDPSEAVPLVGAYDAELFRARPNLSLAASLDGEVVGLGVRVKYLELELARAGSFEPSALHWAKGVSPSEAPSVETAVQMVIAMEDIRVKLTEDEGRWLMDRVDFDDWSAWGSDRETALILRLGPERLVREMDARTLRGLMDWHEGEGLFPEG